MTVESQSWAAFESTHIELEFPAIPDLDTDPSGATPIDLTTRIVRFALARLYNGEPVRSDPVLSYNSDDDPAVVTIPNPDGSTDPHVLIVLTYEKTADLAAGGPTAYYVEVEVTESDSTKPVITSTGTLTLKPNVQN